MRLITQTLKTHQEPIITKILLLVLIGLSVLACNQDKNKELKTSMDSNESDARIQTMDTIVLNDEEQKRKTIQTRYTEELKKCSQTISAVTNFNGKTEFWRICNTEDGKRIIRIESHAGENLYEEIYFEQNGALIYAVESINYTPMNHFTLQPWTCQFFMEDGKLMSLMSLGHGKTEDDHWDPDIIFEMFATRLKELSNIAED